jgi:hypothetical protein
MSQAVDTVPEPSETKRSFVPMLTRLLPYWFTVACFVWAIVIAHAWNSDEAWELIQTQIVDPVGSCDYSVVKSAVPKQHLTSLVLALLNSYIPTSKIRWYWIGRSFLPVLPCHL